MKLKKIIMEKLTLADCFKYPNAVIRTRTDIDGQDYELRQLIYWMGECVLDETDLENYKLILRPLSSLTDEEKKECKKLMKDFYDSITEVNKWQDILETPFGEFSKSGIKAIDYLRSINIDIDNFQEQGKAIYE